MSSKNTPTNLFTTSSLLLQRFPILECLSLECSFEATKEGSVLLSLRNQACILKLNFISLNKYGA